MIEIDLESIDEGEWFPYQNSHFDQELGEWVFEEPADAARVRVRRYHTFLQEKVYGRKRSVEHVYNPKTKAMERITYYDDRSPEETKKIDADIWDYAITGFEGFASKGKIIECTRENKVKMMEDPAFNRFIGRCLRILEGAEARRQEEVEKN